MLISTYLQVWRVFPGSKATFLTLDGPVPAQIDPPAIDYGLARAIYAQSVIVVRFSNQMCRVVAVAYYPRCLPCSDPERTSTGVITQMRSLVLSSLRHKPAGLLVDFGQFAQSVQIPTYFLHQGQGVKPDLIGVPPTIACDQLHIGVSASHAGGWPASIRSQRSKLCIRSAIPIRLTERDLVIQSCQLINDPSIL